MKPPIHRKAKFNGLWVSSMTLSLLFPLSSLTPSISWAQSIFSIHGINNPVVDVITPNLSSGQGVDVTSQLSEISSGTTSREVANQLVATAEEFRALQYGNYFGLELFGSIPSFDQISAELWQLGQQTNTQPALIYNLPTKDALILILVLPDKCSKSVWKKTAPPNSAVPAECLGRLQAKPEDDAPNVVIRRVPNITLKQIKGKAEKFRQQTSDVNSTRYVALAQELHAFIIAPLKSDLEAHRIDTLVFSMDSKLRTLPFAALHDGQQFLVEQYNLALIPSYALVDTRHRPIQGVQVLAMGIETFQNNVPLPGAAQEIRTIEMLWPGKFLLGDDANQDKLKDSTKQKQFGIVHLATHANFRRRAVNNSFIQLSDTKLNLSNLRKIALESQWKEAPIELLVLSACRTALGSNEAELGFTGTAFQTGVKTVIGSLWNVDDKGTLALMTALYTQLKTSASTRAIALRQAQLALLNNAELSHPYYWSAFTVVGNWN